MQDVNSDFMCFGRCHFDVFQLQFFARTPADRSFALDDTCHSETVCEDDEDGAEGVGVGFVDEEEWMWKWRQRQR